MMDKFRQLYTELVIKRSLRRGLSPSREEVEKAHALFMAEIEKRFPLSEQHSSSGWFHYALAALAGIFILNGGAVIYADTADVAATHPLYTYKRVAEEVKVRTATSAKRPEVEIKIAERRIKEMKFINAQAGITATNTMTASSTATSSVVLSTTSKPVKTISKNSGKINIQLKQNFQKHMEALEKHIQKEDSSNRQEKKEIVCQKLNDFHKDVIIVLEQEDDKRQFEQRITKLCAPKIESNEQIQQKPDPTQTQSNVESGVQFSNDSHIKTNTDLKIEAKVPGVEIKGKSGKNLTERDDD
jgi:hypothetical protein